MMIVHSIDDKEVIIMANGHVCVPRKNDEQYMIPEENDWPELERKVWYIRRCPQNHCSKSSWQKTQTWSMISPSACYDYLAYHLKTSGQDWHGLTGDRLIERMKELEGIEIEEYTDTFKMRQEYRDQIKQAFNRRAPETAHPKKKIKREPANKALLGTKASSSGEPSSPVSIAVRQHLMQIFGSNIRDARDGSSTITLKRKTLYNIKDILTRSAGAYSNAAWQMVELANQMNAEKARLTEACQKLENYLGDSH